MKPGRQDHRAILLAVGLMVISGVLVALPALPQSTNISGGLCRTPEGYIRAIPPA